MADQMSISGPVTVQSDGGTARVAYDLMIHIVNWENPSQEQKESREYWLTLFHQCVMATKTNSLSTVLRK
jgi:hypothetical protein